MTNTSIAAINLPSKNLQTIAVGDLRLGMIVHAIAEQMGKLSVKSKGKVKHISIIDKLTASGVKTIVIDNTPAKNGQALAKLNYKRKHIKARKLTASAANTNAGYRDNVEFVEASKLLARSENIYADFERKLQKDVRLDISETKALVSTVYQNLAKNPDALLCVSMIMHSSDYLANHSIHVATLICYFAQKLDMSKQDCEQLALVGYLFDIGMVRVAEDIRNKKGQLTQQEQAKIQEHVQHSLNILSPLKLSPECLLAIEQHHERLDGSGYPNAYSGSKIHKFSRMLAIIDCYDALTSMRAHKKPLSPAAAMKVLSNSDNGYDPKLVLQFIRCMGIYPVGSLVVLSNKRIALVTKTFKNAPTAPEVKAFYCIAENCFVPPKLVNLSQLNTAEDPSKCLRVIRPILPCEYGLDMQQIVS